MQAASYPVPNADLGNVFRKTKRTEEVEGHSKRGRQAHLARGQTAGRQDDLHRQQVLCNATVSITEDWAPLSYGASAHTTTPFCPINAMVPSTQFGAALNITSPPIPQHVPQCGISDDSSLLEMDSEEIVEVIDIDAVDAIDFFPATYSYLIESQRRRLAPGNYMQSVQRDINPQMRGVLIDWLVEVAEEYKLKTETLHLAVNYIDRFLTVTPVLRSKLQLVGVTCMFIAAKYEEIMAPQVTEFVYITDNTYRKDEVIRMETVILQTLRWELTVVTAYAFITRYCRALELCDKTRILAHYIMELTLQDYNFVGMLPSVVAGAAVVVAYWTNHGASWTSSIAQATRSTPEELRHCAGLMFRSHANAKAGQLQAVREKYNHSRQMRVASIPSRPGFML